MPKTVTDLAAAVAERLHIADAATVEPDATSAAHYVLTYTGTDPLPVDAEPDPLVWSGLVLLTERIFQDTGTPSGAVAAAGDPTLSGVYIPEDLSAHLHHYWDHTAITAPVF